MQPAAFIAILVILCPSTAASEFAVFSSRQLRLPPGRRQSTDRHPYPHDYTLLQSTYMYKGMPQGCARNCASSALNDSWTAAPTRLAQFRALRSTCPREIFSKTDGQFTRPHASPMRSASTVWAEHPKSMRQHRYSAQVGKTTTGKPLFFPGFKATEVPVITAIATLLRRNEVLNYAEACCAVVLLGGGGLQVNSFTTTERLLYVVSCLSNAFCLRVARQHFLQVKPDRSDGLLFTIAGIQDLSILFSSITFVCVLRALVQVMEAGIEDPSMVVWLQGFGVLAMAARLIIVQRLLAHRSVASPAASPPLGLGSSRLQHRSSTSRPLEMILKTAFLLSSPLSNLPQQPRFSTSLQLRCRQAQATKTQGACKGQDSLQSMKAQFGIGKEDLMKGKPGSASAGRPLLSPCVSDNERFGEAPVPHVWDRLSPVRLNADANSGVYIKPELQVADVAYTSIDKADLPASNLSAGFVQSLGLSVDVDDAVTTRSGARLQQSDGMRRDSPEYEISGAHESVMKGNMDVLQWTTLSVFMLSLSTVMLAISRDVPHLVMHVGDTDDLDDEVLRVMGSAVDLFEQVVMAVALASARTSFSAVVDTESRDVTHLLEGLNDHRGLGHFLETWGLVQCGVIAAMVSELAFTQPWAEVPAKEVIKVAGELIR